MEEELNLAEADTSEESESDEEGGANDSGYISFVDAVNQATGRSYKSDEEALKGIKETNSYVGKVGKYKDVLSELEKTYGEQGAIEHLKSLKKQEAPDALSEVQKLRDDLWFEKNKDYEPYRKVIAKLRADGQSLEDVVNSEEYRDVFKAKASEPEKQKSVIHSNQRLSEPSTDYQSDLQRAQQTGDWSVFLKKHKGVSLTE